VNKKIKKKKKKKEELGACEEGSDSER